MCRQFSAKARGYMLGYHHQALETEDGREEVKSFERNEKIHKIYRSHRDALSFDGEFISRVMRECITIDWHHQWLIVVMSTAWRPVSSSLRQDRCVVFMSCALVSNIARERK
jgi:hypothetical protein